MKKTRRREGGQPREVEEAAAGEGKAAGEVEEAKAAGEAAREAAKVVVKSKWCRLQSSTM